MYKVLHFDVNGDERGSLVAIEEKVHIPFDIKRVFYVFGSKDNLARGCHANRKTKFVLVAVNGHCKVRIKTKSQDFDVDLDSPQKALYLEQGVWKEMYDFSDDCVLLVLCSEKYDKGEYINDYQQYIAECKYE